MTTAPRATGRGSACSICRTACGRASACCPKAGPEFVSTPAPAWKRPVYGGLFWVNGDGARPVPKTAYFANGAGGQRTIIIPTHDLVVVRMGHHKGDSAGMKALDLALAELMTAVQKKIE